MADSYTSFLASLGNLVLQANYLGEALIDLVWVGKRQNGAELISEVRDKTLGDLVELVVKGSYDEFDGLGLAKDLESLKPLLKKALKERNAFIHASWTFRDDETVDRWRLPREGKKRRGERLRLSIDDVETAIEAIDAAREAAEELYDQAVEQRPPPARGGVLTEDGTYTPIGSKS